MNSSTSTLSVEAVQPHQPQSGHEALDRAIDLQNALSQAYHISYLLQWIADARALLETVREVAGYDKELDARLDENKIMVFSASWAEVHSEALSALIGMQQDLLTEAQGKVH